MANIGKDPAGRWLVQYVDCDNRRRTFRVGRLPKAAVETLRGHIEQLVHAQVAGIAPPKATSRWLGEIGDKLRDKLARFGLVSNSHRQQATTLKRLIELFTTRPNIKPNTCKAWATTHKSLLAYFSEDRDVRTITKGHAKAWRESLRRGRAENTIRKMTAIAKATFNCAIDYEIIETSPFDKLPSTMVENKARMIHVSPEVSGKVLAACPDAEWRLIFALARWGGLRIPSELFALRWSDVLWDQQKFQVRCVKTEHHAGHETRFVPIFPELRPYLIEAYQLAGDGAEFVIGRYRHGAGNLRTQLTRIIERAGEKPWPKLFQNLRSTRETELADRFPIHVVCEWIGNSAAVARKHYLQTTDEHFAAAVEALKSDAQSDAEKTGNQLQDVVNRAIKAGENAEITPVCVILRDSAKKSSGRHKTRTCDLYGVNVAL